MQQSFDVDLGTPGVMGGEKWARSAGIVEEITCQTTPLSESQTHLFAQTHAWEWEQIRDYVVAEIEARTGPFLRDPAKEFGIFSSFKKRWGWRAGAIARYAFEVNNGVWNNQPVAVTRFTKGSDPYFATPISRRLLPA